MNGHTTGHDLYSVDRGPLQTIAFGRRDRELCLNIGNRKVKGRNGKPLVIVSDWDGTGADPDMPPNAMGVSENIHSRTFFEAVMPWINADKVNVNDVFAICDSAVRLFVDEPNTLSRIKYGLRKALDVDLDGVDSQEILNLRHSILEEGIRSGRLKVNLIQPTIAFLHDAIDRGIPCAVASGSPSYYVDPCLETAGLHGRLKAVLTAGMWPEGKGKPHPHSINECKRALGLAPDCGDGVIVLEDGLNGLRAAIAAKAQIVIFKWAMNDLPILDEVLLGIGPYDTQIEVVPEWDHLVTIPMEGGATSKASADSAAQQC